MLAGFHAVDEHFREAPLERNLPVLMGLLAVWYGDFFGAQTAGVFPYDQYLHRFPAYLQQLTMESNGKHVTLEGARVDYDTGAIYWGEPGTNGQHSFYQLLPPGDEADPLRLHRLHALPQPARRAPRPADLQRLRPGRGPRLRQDAGGGPRGGHARTTVVPHRVMEGNRPSNMILVDRLTPHSLGSLVALYEHSVFTQGVIWGIDSFDQWGVELGKALAKRIVPELQADAEPELGPRQLHQRPDPPLQGRPRRRLHALTARARRG